MGEICEKPNAGKDNHWQQFDTTCSLISAPQWHRIPCSGPSSRGCHSHTFCTTICDRGQNRSQESSIKNPASQRSSSVGESSLGEQPTRYGNTTIDINVVDEVLRFSLRKTITCKMFLVGNLCYSKSLAENVAVKRSSVIFRESQRSRAIFHLDRV